MFKPVEVVRVDIYVLKSQVSRVTWALARLRLLHLVDVHGSVAAGALIAGAVIQEETEQQYAAMEERAKRLMASAGLLYDPLGLSIEDVSGEELASFDAQLESLERTFSSLKETARDLAERASSASRLARLLRMLAQAEMDPAALARSGRLAVRIGIVPLAQVAVVEEKIASTPHLFRELGEIDGGAAVLAAFLPADREAIERALGEAKFERFEYPSQPIAAASALAEKREAELSAELHAARETLRRFAAQSQLPLATIRRKSEIALGLARARHSFAAAGHTMIISGWVPKDRLADLKRAVQENAPGAAHVEVIDPGDLRQLAGGATRIPVLFNNPLLLKPFEKITAAYGTPQYSEVEPTAFLAASFLIMFGVMFGDLGQGLLLALAGYVIFRTSLRYNELGVLLIECGLVSAVFGILYGSVFGAESVIPALWFNPMRNVSASIGLALAFGAALISIGLLLNVVNSFRSRDISAAIFGEHGLVGAFTYWVCLAIGTKFLLTGEVGVTGTALALLIGLPALTILFRRPIEEVFRRRREKRPVWREMSFVLVESVVDLSDTFLSYLANTVSFIRISAFSLAHVGLFAAVFALAESLSHLSGGGVWYWVTLALGNVLIILLEGMMASIQAIRLEYYELFSKFFKGGGEEFRPLQV